MFMISVQEGKFDRGSAGRSAKVSDSKIEERILLFAMVHSKVIRQPFSMLIIPSSRSLLYIGEIYGTSSLASNSGTILLR